MINNDNFKCGDCGWIDSKENEYNGGGRKLCRRCVLRWEDRRYD